MARKAAEARLCGVARRPFAAFSPFVAPCVVLFTLRATVVSFFLTPGIFLLVRRVRKKGSHRFERELPDEPPPSENSIIHIKYTKKGYESYYEPKSDQLNLTPLSIFDFSKPSLYKRFQSESGAIPKHFSLQTNWPYCRHYSY